MGLDLQQRIAQLQQKIGANEASGKNTAGLQKKLAKWLKKFGAANTAAGAAVTFGIAALVIQSGNSPSGGPDTATPPGSSVVGSEAGGGIVWGVTIGSDSPTPGDAGTGNAGSSTGSSGTPADPGVAPPDGGSSDGSSLGTDSGSGSGDSTGVGGQDSASGAGGSSGSPNTNDSTANPSSEGGIE